jgi:hypothetical protein
VARMGEKRIVCRLLEGKRPLRKQVGYEWITLSWILLRRDGMVCTGLVSRYGEVEGSY